MMLSAHQPSYMPWLGYVDKLCSCDIFVSMDDVKFSKNSMYARNKIILDGETTILTVPTSSSSKNKAIRDVEICEYKWRSKHLRMIKQAYSKSKRYEKVMPEIEKIYGKKWKWLGELNHEILALIKSLFGSAAEIKIASEYGFSGSKSERIVEYCKAFKADSYLFGRSGKNYADEELFSKNGIAIKFQEFNCPNQKLSFLDYAFNWETNCGQFQK